MLQLAGGLHLCLAQRDLHFPSSDAHTAPLLWLFLCLRGTVSEFLSHSVSQTVGQAASQDPHKLISGHGFSFLKILTPLFHFKTRLIGLGGWYSGESTPHCKIYLSSSNLKIINQSIQDNTRFLLTCLSAQTFWILYSSCFINETILQLNFLCGGHYIAHLFIIPFRNASTLLDYGKNSVAWKPMDFSRQDISLFFFFFFFCYVLHSHVYLYPRAPASMKPESSSNYKINSNSNIHHSISIQREQFWLDRLTLLRGWVRLMSA